ncbi:MAG: DUF2283 domain-containing protein [Candidatus Binatia bacterium]
MKISYDKDADALYIRFLDGKFECRVVRLSEDVALDFAPGERLVGMEILGASRIFKSPDRPSVELEHLLASVAPPSGPE